MRLILSSLLSAAVCFSSSYADEQYDCDMPKGDLPPVSRMETGGYLVHFTLFAEACSLRRFDYHQFFQKVTLVCGADSKLGKDFAELANYLTKSLDAGAKAKDKKQWWKATTGEPFPTPKECLQFKKVYDASANCILNDTGCEALQ